MAGFRRRKPRRTAAGIQLLRKARKKAGPAGPVLLGRQRSLYVEAEVDHVAVLDDVLLALAAQQSLFLCRRDAAAADHVVEIDRFGADEAALDVGVDLAGGLGSLGALFDGPGAALVLTVGQEGDETQQVIAALDETCLLYTSPSPRDTR